MITYMYKNWAKLCLPLALIILMFLAIFHDKLTYLDLLVWVQFIVYLIHEFEEHVYPGKFKIYINKEIFKEKIDSENIPLNDKEVFYINIIDIWIFFPLFAFASLHNPIYGVFLPIFGIFNATLHIIMAFKLRKYNPGLLVSILLNYPTGIYTLNLQAASGVLTTGSFWGFFILTVILHAILVIYVVLKYKNILKNRAAKP